MDRRIPTDPRALCAGCLAAIGALSYSVPCAAQDAPRASLVVTRGDGAQDCPDAAQLAEQVRAVAGRNVVSVGLGQPTETWIQVTIARSFGSYTAQISTLGARHGTRSLEDLGPSCASLADAIAVTIAIFLDPYANGPLPELLFVPPQSRPEPPAPARVATPPAVRARFPQLLLAGSGGVAFNLLEHSEPLVNASLGTQLSSRWSLALGGAFVFPDTKATNGGEIELGLSYAYLAACARAWGDPESARIDWCAAPLLGSFAGSGKGYRETHAERSAWFALSLGPEVVFPVSRHLSWLVSAQGIAPLVSQSFTVQSGGARSNAFRSAAVGGALSLGVRGAL
ncbi:MAG: hypothetical protein ABUL62_01030 [Myxococcales bacterium]